MNRDRKDEEHALKRVLSAASARPGELPELSPFFLGRLRAAMRASAAEADAHPIGAAAWKMLPAFGLLVALLSVFAGYQTVQTQRERTAAMDDLLLAAALLGGPEAPAPEGLR